MEDSFDRFYRAMNRFFASPRFHLGMTIGIGLLAVAITLAVILQPVPVNTKVAGIGTSVVLWIFTLTWLNWWQKLRIIYAWKQEREELSHKIERANAYFAKVAAGELPDGPLPPEIRQDLQDILADWRRELLRQEGLEPPQTQR